MQNKTSKVPFVVTVMSTKGGTTKSTVANIGAFCSEHGLKVLIIDRYATYAFFLLH